MITFNRFKTFSEKEIENEKKMFLDYKIKLLNDLLFQGETLSEEEKDISNLDKSIKHKLSMKSEFYRREPMISFLCELGIHYDLLDKNEKEQLYNMDFTFENFQNFVNEKYNRIIENAKKTCPSDIHMCFKDIYFITFCQTVDAREIKYNTFLYLIRDYFILNYGKNFEEYRKNDVFDEIKIKMEKMYPKLKEKYGINKYVEKFLSFIFGDNDYNIEPIKEMLDNYYNQKNNKYIKLKQKED